MKRFFLFMIMGFFLLFNYSYGEVGIKYIGNGAGGQLSFAVTDVDGGAFGFGFHGIMEIAVEKIGVFQLNPSICFWFNSSKTNKLSKIYYRQISLNIFDAKYLFPVPKSIFVRPYCGGGLCILVDGWEEEVLLQNGITVSNSDRNGSVGFNFYGGIDLPVSTVFIPYFETRFTAGDIWVFRLTMGCTFRFH